MKRIFVVSHDNPARAKVCERAIESMRERYKAGESFEIEIREPRRTLDSNACLWATLTDIAEQVEWPHTESGEWRIGVMSKDSWKAVLTAAFEQETAQAQGIGGGTVMLGARTSQYSRRKMGEFIEFVTAFGADKGVKWSAGALEEQAQWAPAERREA